MQIELHVERVISDENRNHSYLEDEIRLGTTFEECREELVTTLLEIKSIWDIHLGRPGIAKHWK